MAIITIPAKLQPKLFFCSLCRVGLTLDKASAGIPKSDKTLGLACISHFWEVELLIVGWADFIASERREYNRRADNSIEVLYQGGENARFDS